MDGFPAGWRVLSSGANTYFRTGSFPAGARLLAGCADRGGLADPEGNEVWVTAQR